MSKYTLHSPYAPFLNVGTVCLDAFVVDDQNLQSKFYQERKEFLSKNIAYEGDNLVKSKQETASRVGELSGQYGSFWIDLGIDCADQSYDKMKNEFSQDNVVRAARSLFLNVPDDLKKGKLAVDKFSGKIGRGYLPWGSESGANEVFEIKEGFAFGYNWDRKNDDKQPSNPMEEHNKWPACTENIDSKISFSSKEKSLLEDETVDLMNDIGNLLLRAYSMDLQNDEMLLPNLWSGSESWNLTRIFRYFSCNSIHDSHQKTVASKTERMGSAPHTDWGLLTVIIACDEPGLQLLKTSDIENSTNRPVPEDYITVLPQFHENKLFVNCGDFMSLMSNGKYLSPKHRVIPPIATKDDLNVERTSIVHFFYPRYDVKLPPIKELSPKLQEKYSVFSDQREAVQSKNDYDREISSNGEDAQLNFGDIIASKWTQVAR